MITLIAGRDRNGAIGKDNTIPWHAPEDLAFFQRETRGGAMIMGRNTWDSLPFKPLKNRLNLVVTSRDCDAEHCFTSIEAAVEAAQNAGYRRIYSMGGFRVYNDMLPIADRILLTEVDTVVDEPDTFFPTFDANEWIGIGQSVLRTEAPGCVVHEYLRRQPKA